jgi:hypothetical protein
VAHRRSIFEPVVVNVPTWVVWFAFVGGLSLTVVIFIVVGIKDRKAREEADTPESEPQIVGQPCVFCRDTIRGAPDAGLCKRCRKPLHRACARDHRRAAHTSRGGYR